mgnify:CR=1 FL=1
MGERGAVQQRRKVAVEPVGSGKPCPPTDRSVPCELPPCAPECTLGDWTTVGITTVGADARTRADLRNDLLQNRFGELREGLWLRPANLAADLPAEITTNARVLTSRDDDPAGLAAVLWDLSSWIATARDLLDEIASAPDVPGRFVAAAAIVRHLLADPVLPAELLPTDWPGAQLRQAYADFAAELIGRRDEMEAP